MKNRGENEAVSEADARMGSHVQSKSMIVGVSERFSDVFEEEEQDLEVPEDFQPSNTEYDGWLG